jgi:hypothetical protein
LALHFDVDVDPVFFAGGQDDAHQGIGKAFAQLGIAHHLAQFGVFEFVALAPVDLDSRLGKVKGHELRKTALKHGFPGAVVVVSGGGVRCGGVWGW